MLRVNETNQAQAILIDYGMATRYLDDDGNHLSNEKVPAFKGNFMFASSSSLSFNRTSRKDDMVSLCYMMLMLFNDKEIPYLCDGLS
jgi:hypothetical protein